MKEKRACPFANRPCASVCKAWDDRAETCWVLFQLDETVELLQKLAAHNENQQAYKHLDPPGVL